MILIVDDEKRGMANYLEELEELREKSRLNDEIHYESGVDSALAFFDENYTRLSLVILDIMMPFEKSFDKESTEGGLRTGLKFFERIRQKAPELLVVMFTNVKEQKAIEWFDKKAKTQYFLKQDYLPFEFGEAIIKLLTPQSEP